MSTVRPQPLAEGRFQLIEVIGEGGMATVYRAYDQRLQRPRAIKILSPAFAQRPALRRRFLSEAQTMANLENARVVRIFDMGEDRDRVYIVMELIEGGSLVDRVRVHGALPPKMATLVTIELCEAIHAAHEASVIHRDIKPHNVLLTKSGEVRITDFGIAQVQADDHAGMTRTGAVLGTWGFMAPEQKSNAKQVDARADIYSIGGTLWSLLKNDTPPELFMPEAEPEWFEGIPAPLAEVIRQSTRYRREERYPSARSLGDALRAVLPLLPDDPADTPDLVPRIPERQSNASVTDTMAQLESEQNPSNPRPAPEGTMVPPESAAGNTVDYGGSIADEAADDGFRPEPRRDSLVMKLLPILAGGVAIAVAAGVIYVAGPGQARNELPLPPTTVPADVATQVLPTAVTPEAVTEPVVAPAVLVEPAAVPPVNPPRVPASPQPVVAAVVAPVVTPAVAATETPAAPVVPKAPSGKLSTSAPAIVAPGENFPVRATISGRYTLKLYYRPVGGGAFRDKPMNALGRGEYTAAVRADDTMTGGIEYFVAATDPSGGTVREGSAMKPLKATVGL